MNKKEFIDLYSVCKHLAENSYNILGLKANSFVKSNKQISESINDEVFYKTAEIAEKNENGTLKKDEKGGLILSHEAEIVLHEELKELYKEEVETTLIPLYIPTFQKDSDIFKMPPALYDLLNGVLFYLSEEDYLSNLNADKEEKNG